MPTHLRPGAKLVEGRMQAQKRRISMRRFSLSILAAGWSLIFAASGMAQPSQANQSQQQAQQEVQDQYTRQIMEPDGIRDLKVHDAHGEEFGTIHSIVLDAREGRIAYIVVRSGGTFGIGAEESIIPWSAVQFQLSAQRGEPGDPILVVNVPRDKLLSAPHGNAQDIDRKYAQLIHDYYGVAPYWETPGHEKQQQEPMQQPSAQPLPPAAQQPR
jgi:sporulation protein YlmC with PRC-barrel domain